MHHLAARRVNINMAVALIQTYRRIARAFGQRAQPIRICPVAPVGAEGAAFLQDLGFFLLMGYGSQSKPSLPLIC
jgi:long-subunit acyl-CoA synthetase (AMP-forming)